MKLQTTIPVSPQSNQIDYNSKVLLLGSCFAENMGDKLGYFKFQNLQNPFGIIFNPYSIQVLVERAVAMRLFTENDLFQKDERWYCFEVHSSLSGVTREDFLVLLNDRLHQLRNYLKDASHIILTYGTAWVYRHIATDEIVANCHKIPQKEFSKELLDALAIHNSVKKTIYAIRELNKDAAIIGTVSPVRHLKDGFVENSRSKAHLIAALHGVEDLHYFPAFELMMDELRDYRFYEGDLLHPNATAIEIIWERFKDVWISSETAALQKEIDAVQKGLRHKPFHPESLSHKAFQENLQKQIKTIQEKFQHINFS